MRETTQYRIGTSGWSYPDWKGRFYPEDLAQSRWFEYYAKIFSTVEVNATFYRTFKDQTYQKWYDRAQDHFKYVLKAPRIITHRKYLKDVEADVQKFWHSVSLLKEKFGLILLQLAPATAYDPELLKKSLIAFENPRKVAVEFRNKKWFTSEIKEILKEVGAVICNADSPKIELTDWLTSDIAYIRLHGRKRWYAYDYSAEELREIRDLADRLSKQGAKEIYIFFNNDFEGNAPMNALTLLEMLESVP